jgi:hypothetical protein
MKTQAIAFSRTFQTSRTSFNAYAYPYTRPKSTRISTTTADCAGSGSHWLRWFQLFRCSGSHVALQTERLERPRLHGRPEDLAGQEPKLKAAEAEAEAAAAAGVVEALAPEPLDAGNVSRGYRRADRRAVADDSHRATLSDVTRIVDGEGQEGSQEAEAAYEGREVSLHRSACAGQVVRSRLLAKGDERGDIRLGLVMVEAGRDHKVRMAPGSRPSGDDTLVGNRESCAAEGVGACSLVQVPSLPSAAAVGPPEPSAAALTDRPMAKEDVLAAEHDVHSSPAEEGTSSGVTAHDGVEVMEAVV